MASQVASAINIWLRLHEEWSCSNYPNPSFQPLTRLRTSTCFIRQFLGIFVLLSFDLVAGVFTFMDTVHFGVFLELVCKYLFLNSATTILHRGNKIKNAISVLSCDVYFIALRNLTTELKDCKRKETSMVSGIIRTFVLFGPKEVFDQPITVLRVLLNYRSESTSKTRALC